MAIVQVFMILLIAAITLALHFIRKHLNYWAERGVVHEKPHLFYGNMKAVGSKQPLKQPFHDLYQKYKDKAPFGGFYLSLRKAVVLFDLELIKRVMITDFNDFSHRGGYYNEKDDPLSGHLFQLDGPRWKQMRMKLTPTFTSGKMKFMFPTVVEVGERFINVLSDLIQKDDVVKEGLEIRELLARFTTDVIGCCAFGLECNSLKDPEAKFRKMGQKVFTERRHGRLLFAFAQAFPDLARKFGMAFIPEDVSQFFMKVVKDTVEYREREKVERNDFMNLLIELKNRNDTEGLTLEQIAAQAFVFFLAGFETSSSTMGFALYELAIHQDMQTKVRQEINGVLKQYDGKLTYEGVKELKYLQQILYETMRKYPVASLVVRKALVDYKVANSPYTIEKGTVVIIPIDAIHHDAAIYPSPSEFIPERFAAEEIAKRHSMSWIPFGEGPRNCIGLRFGKMQAMVGLALLLRNFKFTLSAKTPVPLVYDEKAVVLTAKGGIYLNLEAIQA
ncbi:cytochrome P450 6a8 [Stomoxys calcitrans]|uniref:cytochrome P450 6a8 n=1 Tax=Stomoxys calcitrans TaxID=35570 RepID=UPI0027E28C08|nr:cytochrome P450 6a8 [Stomoxys calcitrans]